VDQQNPNPQGKPRPTPLSPHLRGQQNPNPSGGEPQRGTPPTSTGQPTRPDLTQPHQGGYRVEPENPPAQYDPNRYLNYDQGQYPQQQGQQPGYGAPPEYPGGEPMQQYPQEAYREGFTPRNWLDNMPPWFPRDPNTQMLLGAGGILLIMCLGAMCVIMLILGRPIPAPTTPTQDLGALLTPSPIVIVVTSDPGGGVGSTPLPGVVDSSKVGTVLNPFQDAGLDGMQMINVDILDAFSGTYARAATVIAGSAQMEQFTTALNIANFVTARDFNCPDHVRLSITRADSSVVVIGLCLKNAVIVRGDLPNLGGNDLPMGPYFIDIIKQYLSSNLLPLLP